MEPIAGYSLVEKLGDGGFGEVWKVTAPGGLFKALKIIYGDLSGPRAEQELKALERIKAVRHPFLLSLERFEVVHDRLLIVTELAEGSLFDRFTEYLNIGLRGVPREELVGYLRDAAEALDYLNEAHGLQHLDIKARNLLLVSGRIKVADFGLVKNLLGGSATITGGVTPVYAAPEVFDGRVSRYSDQYSLAITYQELLTGTRPFPGTTPFQLAAQHSSASPILGPLPPQDQPIIARALAKVPERRFPSCRALIEALSSALPSPAPVAPARERSVFLPRQPSDGAAAFPAPSTPRPWQTSLLSEDSATAPAAAGAPAGAGDPRGFRPTLFVGLGGAAGAVLRSLRRRLSQRFGGAAALPIFQTLLLDTDRAGIRSAQQGEPGEALAPDETLLCPLRPPDHYREQARGLLRWLGRHWLHGIPRSLRPEGVRPLGRLALLDNAAAVLDRLRQALSRLSSESARTAAVGATGRALRDETPRVFVVASVTGGTGGGMLWDVTYALRQLLGELNLPATGLCGLLLYASPPRPDQQYRARVNTYATLRELNHWCRPDVGFPGAPEQKLAGFEPGRPPFEECYLLHLGDGLGEAEAAAAADRVAAYLCFDATAGGACLDRLRHNSRKPGVLRTFGLAGADFARGALVERASRLLCQRLVGRWLGEVSPGDRDRLERRADRRLAEMGLLAQPLVDRMRQGLADAFDDESQPVLAAAHQGRPLSGQALARLVQQIDGVLGPVGVPEREGAAVTGTIELTRQESARGVGEQLGRGLAEWLLDEVEDVDGRLAVAACSFDRIIQHLRAEADGTRAWLAECRSLGQDMRRQLLGDGADSKWGALRWMDFQRLRLYLSDTGELLQSYICLRQQEIALEGALEALEVASAHAASFHDLKQCRQKVDQLADLFSVGPAENDPATAGLTPLMPLGADGLVSATEALLERLPPETIRGLEAQVQAEVLDPRGGLWGVVGNPPDDLPPEQSRDPAAELREQLLARARSAVSAALENSDAATLFLEQHDSAAQARHAVLDLAQQARPPLSPAKPWHHMVLALPGGSSGTTLRDLATEALTGSPLTVVDGYDGVAVFHEVAGLKVAAVAAALGGDDAGCAELAARVQSRNDVAWSDWDAG
jgi:hypothetical protein